MPGRSDNQIGSDYSNGYGDNSHYQSQSMDPGDAPRGIGRENSRLWLNREKSKLYLHRENSRLYLNRENSKLNLGPLNREGSRIHLPLKREESLLNMGIMRENSRFNMQQTNRHERKRAKKQPGRDVEQFMQILRDRQGLQRETTDLRLRRKQPLPGIGESPRDKGLDVPFTCVNSEEKNFGDGKRYADLSAPSPESDEDIELSRINNKDLKRRTPSPPASIRSSPKMSHKFEAKESPKFPRKLGYLENCDSPSLSRKRFGENTDSPSLSRKFPMDPAESPPTSRKFGTNNSNDADQSPSMSRKYGSNSNRHRMNLNTRNTRMVNTGNKLVPLTRRMTAGHHLPPLIHEEEQHLPDRPSCPQPNRTPPHPDSLDDCFDDDIREEPIDYMDLE
ncbi:uncharacterized protein LOC141914586 [Tubulanus polymorphus]|uniref:uncharacterized protein LOC141914586 n=1 Tax=Tubulanus polymorphus TaxID=672921 RepID=UPI003DA648DE